MTNHDDENNQSIEHEFEEFAKLAIEKFGDKVRVTSIQIDEETITNLKATGWKEEDIQALKEYKAVWLVENKCPECGRQLDGPFGTFEWGFIHGVGSCGIGQMGFEEGCHKVNFRMYHYFGGNRLTQFSVTGF